MLKNYGQIRPRNFASVARKTFFRSFVGLVLIWSNDFLKKKLFFWSKRQKKPLGINWGKKWSLLILLKRKMRQTIKYHWIIDRKISDGFIFGNLKRNLWNFREKIQFWKTFCFDCLDLDLNSKCRLLRKFYNKKYVTKSVVTWIFNGF